ncbi:MAG TPA: HWE histidine kinase domain-containing protein, partial [Acidisoma sp.]|nr:HWE histidine kinase domain-containing protein [Acidisoma sp.]
REIFLTFFPAVLIASFWGGFWSGATTLCVGALLGDFFWLRHMENLHWPLFGLQFLLGYLVTGTMILVAAMVFQRVLAAHRASETEARLLAREMRHRLRNVLGLVTAISRQTARRSKTIDEYEDHFESRMDALGAALAVNSAEEEGQDDLDALLGRVLMPFGHDRCKRTGPHIQLREVMATPLALTVHELATNAVKYGALSVPEGRIEITWERQNECVLVEWREIGGPLVQPPQSHGFGTRLIRSIFSPGVGETEIVYDAAGVICRIRF